MQCENANPQDYTRALYHLVVCESGTNPDYVIRQSASTAHVYCEPKYATAVKKDLEKDGRPRVREIDCQSLVCFDVTIEAALGA